MPVAQQWLSRTLAWAQERSPGTLLPRISVRTADWSSEFEDQLRELVGLERRRSFRAGAIHRIAGISLRRQHDGQRRYVLERHPGQRRHSFRKPSHHAANVAGRLPSARFLGQRQDFSIPQRNPCPARGIKSRSASTRHSRRVGCRHAICPLVSHSGRNCVLNESPSLGRPIFRPDTGQRRHCI